MRASTIHFAPIHSRPRRFAWAAFLILAAFAASAQAAPITPAHDPEIIREGDIYCMFATGYGVTMAKSRDLVSWDRLPSVFYRIPKWMPAGIPGTGT